MTLGLRPILRDDRHDRCFARHDVVAMIDDACQIGRNQRQDAGLPAATPDDELSIACRLRWRLNAARVVPVEGQVLVAHRQRLQGLQEDAPGLPRGRVEHAAEQVRIVERLDDRFKGRRRPSDGLQRLTRRASAPSSGLLWPALPPLRGLGTASSPLGPPGVTLGEIFGDG